MAVSYYRWTFSAWDVTILLVNQQAELQTASSLEELRSRAGDPLRRVTLSCGLSEVPDDIRSCSPHVEFLDLSRNNLATLPDWLDQLPSLKILFLSYNHFTEIPEVLGRCRSLRMLGMRNNQIEHIPHDAIPASVEWLTLTNNHITLLPESVGALRRLRKLLLAGNQLAALPTSLRNSETLELIRLSANKFDAFPTWLFEIPSLAWLALAGNPCTSRNDDLLQDLPPISWESLSIKEELGRGASGSTYRALHTLTAGSCSEVAVKIFSADVSSDGDSHDEMAAAIHAGRHVNLISTIAPLEGHPHGQRGLVLDLISPTFRNLASPPSFESCTRDVYFNDATFTPRQVATYAHDIASAAQHLHGHNIIHGDLYAHNILVDHNRALVSDFGAACIYEGAATIPPYLPERVEIRAFGIVLEELLTRAHSATSAGDALLLERCSALAHLCLDTRVSLRPSFEQAQQLLGKLL